MAICDAFAGDNALRNNAHHPSPLHLGYSEPSLSPVHPCVFAGGSGDIPAQSGSDQLQQIKIINVSSGYKACEEILLLEAN